MIFKTDDERKPIILLIHTVDKARVLGCGETVFPGDREGGQNVGQSRRTKLPGWRMFQDFVLNNL